MIPSEANHPYMKGDIDEVALNGLPYNYKSN